MDDLSFYAVLIINTIILVRNGYLTIRKKVEPSLAMWIFFSFAVIGSLATYLKDGAYSPLDNILNTSDIILCVSLSLIILIFGSKGSRFNRFEVGCLAVVMLMLVFWFFSQAHFLTNLSLQLIQFIAYFPVYYRMWSSGENRESFMTWILLFAVSVISLFTAHGTLAVVYSLRATFCTAVLLILMIRLELKNRRLVRTGLKSLLDDHLS